MTNNKNIKLGAIIAAIVGILSIGGVIWAMSAKVSRIDVTQEFHERRLHRVEVLTERLDELPVIKNQMQNIEQTVKRIESKMR